MARCTVCGSNLAEAAHSCPDCGTALRTAPLGPTPEATGASISTEPSVLQAIKLPPPEVRQSQNDIKGGRSLPYQAQISRQNPSCILFLVDQSGSMSDPLGGHSGRSKADGLADAINRLLLELTIRCTKNQSEGIRNYYDVGVLGYGKQVGSAWGGSLAQRVLVPISDVGNNPAKVDERKRKVEDGADGLVEETIKMPVWFYPVASSGTPMCEALRQSQVILQDWISAHQDSFPPMVINITDGEATDGDPVPVAEHLKQLATQDGNLLLFNLHLSSHAGPSVQYPDSEAVLLDEFAVQLFRMSSVLPPHVQSAVAAEGYTVSPQARGFVFNAGIVEVIKFLSIGTQAKELR